MTTSPSPTAPADNGPPGRQPAARAAWPAEPRPASRTAARADKAGSGHSEAPGTGRGKSRHASASYPAARPATPGTALTGPAMREPQEQLTSTHETTTQRRQARANSQDSRDPTNRALNNMQC